MPAGAEGEVETVALYGAIFGAALLLLSRPGRELVRYVGCGLFRWAASVDRVASVATAGAASPAAPPSPFGPPPPPSPFGPPVSTHTKDRSHEPPGSLGSLGSSASLGIHTKGAGHGTSPLWAFWAFLHIGDFEIMRDVGSDAALYLRFQRMVIKLLLPMSLADILILAPLHARAGAGDSSPAGMGEVATGAGDAIEATSGGALTQFMRSTTAHNLPAHSWVLWVDLAMCYVFSLIMFRFIHHFQRDILSKFNSIEAQTAATACTALVRNIPKKGVCDTVQLGAQMHGYLQQLYGARSVVSCVAVPCIRPLYLLQQRCEVVAQRALFLSLQQQGQEPSQRRPSWCARRKLSRINQEVKQLRASIEKERAKVPPFCGLAFVTFARPETQKQFLDDWGPCGCRGAGRLPGGAEDASNTIGASLWSVRRAPDHEDIRWEALHVGRLSRLGRSVVINAVIAVVLFFCTTPVAFFNQLHRLIQSTEGEDDDMLDLWIKGSSSGSACCGNSSGIVGDVPAAASEGLALLQELSTLGEQWPEPIRLAVFDYLPSLIIVALNLLVLCLMEIPARSFEMKSTHSEIEAAIAWRTFSFLLLNMVVMPLVAMDAANDVFLRLLGPTDDEAGSGEIFTRAQLAVQIGRTDNSAYFATILLQAALVSCAYQLLHTHEYVTNFFCRCFVVTDEEKNEMMLPWPHQYGYHLAYAMLMFVIGLTHSITSPAMLPLTLAYFCAKHLVDKYNLLFVRPHTLKNSGAFLKTLESFIVMALLFYQLNMTLFFFVRLDLRSDVLGASSIALLCLTAGLLLLSLAFYLGILQRALCPYSEALGNPSSLEKMATAGEKLRESLVDGMGRGGVLRQIVAKIERTASQTGSFLSLNGSFSTKRTKSDCLPKLKAADIISGTHHDDGRVTIAGSSGGTKHRRHASDGSDGGGDNVSLSVYSKELHRWVGADASQHITVDKKGTPHKNRVSKTPTNTTPTATISATESVKRRLKFLRPSPSVSRREDQTQKTSLDRATSNSDQCPPIALQDQRSISALSTLPSKPDEDPDANDKESRCTDTSRLSSAAALALVSEELDDSGGFHGVVSHDVTAGLGLPLQLDSSNMSLGLTSPQDLPTPMRNDATHNRLENVQSAGSDHGIEREEEASSRRRRRRRAQSFVSASRRPRKLSVVGGVDSSAIMGTPALTPRATPRPSSGPEIVATPEARPRPDSSAAHSVSDCGSALDPEETWSYRKQMAFLSDLGQEPPTPIPGTHSASGSVDLELASKLELEPESTLELEPESTLEPALESTLEPEAQPAPEPEPEPQPAPAPEPEPEPQPEPEPEPEPQPELSSSEDEYDAAPPPRESPAFSADGAIHTPASVLKRRKGRSTSLENSVVVGGSTGSSFHGSLHGSAVSDGQAVNASSMSDGGARADGSRLQKRQRAAYLKLVAAIQLRRGSSNRKMATGTTENLHRTCSDVSQRAPATDNDEEFLCVNDSPTAAALFAKIDRDGLGYLGKAEVAELATLLGLQLTPEEIDHVIECMDLDNDGVVAADEFKSWWKTPKLVRGAVYSPTADAANAQDFAHLYELPVSYGSHAAP